MSRYRHSPPEYAPGLVLNLREQPEGGGLKRPGALAGSAAAQRHRECVVLVHGFNNHEGEAAAAYLGFRRSQQAAQPSIDAHTLDTQLGDCFWPGDARWPGPIDWLDFLVYPAAVHTAPDAGAALADLLRRLQAAGLLRVSFIGHSLGCRVVLEALRDVLAGGGPALGRISLMAAAVPIEMLSAGGAFETLFKQLASERVPVQVLHSSQDRVLRSAFPPGQILAGPQEASIRALGLKGPPPAMPGMGGNVRAQRVEGAGHGDYWGHSPSAAASQAADLNAAFFQFTGSSQRSFSQRAVDSRPSSDVRNLGQRRDPG